jgi:arylsulfatase A-like enzyme
MLFCNRPIDADRPHIVDIAPTVLDLFGVPIPAHMDGKAFMRNGPKPQAPASAATPQGNVVPQSI